MIVYINDILVENINWNSFSIEDNIDNSINTCSFSITNDVAPTIMSEIEVYHEEEKIFGGSILRTETRRSGLVNIISVECVDYTYELGKDIIVERLVDKTVNEIIEYLLNKYHIDFTSLSDCDITIDTFTCNNISTLDAIEKLAEATNYRWYVDYDKNIKFFAQGTEVADFNIEDGEYVYNSLVLKNDGSQLRNSVKIRGGNTVGIERTETKDGDGTKKIFSLSNKFSEAPTVSVASTPVTVGVDYIDSEDDFTCLWNYNEKYLKFKVAPVAGTNNIEITGTPLVPIIIQREDSDSIVEYGLNRFYKRDNTISSQDEALQYAVAQLEAYKNTISEGSFRCFQRVNSGETINIGVDEYIIQSVGLIMTTPIDPEYKVSMASTKTTGIIEFLQGLLKIDRKIIMQEQELEALLTLVNIDDTFDMEDALEASTTWDVTSPPYTFEDTTGEVEVNPIHYNFFTWYEE